MACDLVYGCADVLVCDVRLAVFFALYCWFCLFAVWGGYVVSFVAIRLVLGGGGLRV